jgi:Uma2 family endonuclease
MQAAPRGDFVTVADYLATEEKSDVRHEYLGGLVYAMAGETTTHNQIAQNLLLSLRASLKDGRCRVYISDIRVNFDIRNDEYFCYPDVVVTCDKRDTHARFVRYPKLIIEVLSEGTERIDKREKFLACTNIESLEEYVLVSQTNPEVTLYRRSKKWQAERIAGERSSVTVESLKLKLPFSTVYEGV